MPTKNYPAPVHTVAAALDVCPTAGTRKIEAAEIFLDNFLDSIRLPARRTDRAKTAFIQPLLIIAKLARHRPPEEFATWLETYWADRTHTRRFLKNHGSTEILSR